MFEFKTSYSDLVAKVRSFNRDPLMFGCAWECWKASKESRDANESPEARRNRIYRQAYTPRILSISAAVGNNYRNKTASREDILKIGSLLTQVDDSVCSKELIDQEVSEFGEALKQSSVGRFDYPDDISKFVTKVLMVHRTFRSQWALNGISIRNLLRAFVILKNADRHANGMISRFVEGFTQQKLEHSMRSLSGIFILADASADTQTPGCINVERSSVDLELTARYGLDLDVIRLLTRRLSTPVSEFRSWHDNAVLSLPETYRKYAPTLFYRSPLIDALGLKGMPERDNAAFVVPSPEILLASLSEFYVREIRNHQDKFHGIDVLTKMGDGLEDYVYEVLKVLFGNESVLQCPKEDNGKKADFIIELEEATFVVEVKRSLGGVDYKTIATPAGMVALWDRLFEGYEQCSATAKELTKNRRTKPIIAFILVDDSMGGESILFDLYRLHSGMRDYLKLEFVEVMSIDYFESIFSACGPSEIIGEILAKWEKANLEPKMENFRWQMISIRNPKSRAKFPHLDKEFECLFPGLAKRR